MSDAFIKTLHCPHCHGVLQIPVVARFDIGEPLAGDGLREGAQTWYEALDEADKALIDACGPVLAAFAEAYKVGTGNEAVDYRRPLLQFFRQARRIEPAPTVQKLYGQERTFHLANGVGLVRYRGEIEQFVPAHLLVGRIRRTHEGRRRATRDPVALQDALAWVRGRYGYVPATSTAFAEALRQRSFGDFAGVRQ